MKLLKQRLLAVLIFGTISLTFCANLGTTALSPTGATVTLENIKEFSILIPKQATAQEKYSATMLRDYFGKMYDTKLTLVQEPQVVKGKIISVGNTAAAKKAKIKADPREQAYKLAVAAGNLYIMGGTRGPIYGVIALLEEDLGCRWYAKDDAPVIPKHSKSSLTFVPRSYSPIFEIREILYTDAYDTQWAAFNRIQPLSYFTKMSQETGGGLANPAYFIHTYHRLIPASEYFATHPEYFPLRNGKRYPSENFTGQLCYTSEGVVAVMVKKLDAAIANNPGMRFYSVSENDNTNDNCECSPCQKIIKTDGISGAKLQLANRVAAKLAVKYPNIKINTLAYNKSQTPPKNIKPGPNTVVFYAPIRQRMNRISMLLPIGDIGKIKEELAGWHKLSSRIYLWDYADTLRGAPIPFPNFDAQDRGWDFLIKNGVTGIFMQACFAGHGSLGELKSWLYAKKLWNPKWSQNELIEEFIASYYGPAAVEMAEYVALQRRAWANFYANRKPGTGLTFSDAEIKQMYKLLNTAMEHCNGRPEYTIKIERELLTLLSLSLSSNPSKDTASDYSKKLKQAEALIIKLKKTVFGEGTSVAQILTIWHKKLKRASENNLPRYSKNSITLKEFAYSGARYLPDSGASEGHAVRQLGGIGNKKWGVKFPYGDFMDRLKPGKVYIVRLRVKQAIKNVASIEDGILFTLGAYSIGGASPGIYSTIFTGNISAKDNGKYRWIELGKLQVDNPGAVGTLYCFSGKDLAKGNAVWYDYIEFVPEEEYKSTKQTASMLLMKL